LLSGCTYHGALDSSIYYPQNISEKIPATACLGSGAKVVPVKEWHYNVETQAAVMDASTKMLAGAFSNVGTSCKDSQFVAEPSFELSGIGTGVFAIKLCMSYYRCGVDGIMVEHCSKQVIPVFTPKVLDVLRLITGIPPLPLVLGPITLSIMNQFHGHTTVDSANIALAKQFDTIQTDTIGDKDKFTDQ
jgi:hypothetical protein